VPIWVEKGLVVALDDVQAAAQGQHRPGMAGRAWDPGRAHTIPWQWGSTGIAVNTSVYGGDINTSAVFLDVPADLSARSTSCPR
jgi:spermidine/putrescine transport system substrate-binding protein